MTREREIEKDIIDFAEMRGWWSVKFTTPTRNGVPDRIFLREKDGFRRVVFIEVKKVGETPTTQQAKVHREMRQHGAEVYWTDNLEQAKEWLR